MNGEGRPFAEPDRRYWRRRVNRHVRKARRTRALLRVAGIVAANLAATALVVLFGVSVVHRLTSTSELAVRRILVDGTARTTPDAVRAALAPFVGDNLLELSLADVATAARKDPWVKDVSVKRKLPGTLRVTVTERAPAALALQKGRVLVVDGDGATLGPVGPSFPFDLPLLTGLPDAPGPAFDAAAAAGVRALERLATGHPAWARGISEIDLSRPDRVVVSRIEGGPRLILDPEDVDRNLDSYLALRGTIARKIGSVATVDLRWSRRISVLPSGEASLTEND